jgi:hypothetical protein
MDRPANVVCPSAGANLCQAVAKCLRGAIDQPPALLFDRPYSHRFAGIRHVAIHLDGDVEFHDIARRKPSFAWNPMHNLVVDADAVLPRKSLDQLRRRTASGGSHDGRSNLIQLSCADSGPHRLFHRIQDRPRHLTRKLHTCELFS